VNRSDFDKKKNHVAVLFGVLLIVAIGVCIYLFFMQSWAKSGIDDLVNADYTPVHAEKGANEAAAGLPITQKSDYPSSVDIYDTPMGFPIVSYSQSWTGDKLKDIYNELTANKHGKEMYSVSEVMIYPGESALDVSGGVAGTHVTEQKMFTLFFYLPGLVPESLEYDINSTQSTIELYNMDKFDSVTQIARTISHEYGHHYTMYYFMPDDTTTKSSDYYLLRGIDGFDHDVFFEIESEYYENHMWSVYEIAAEDYVQLMGSPTAKQQKEYLDIYDVLDDYNKNKGYTAYADATVSNVYPQENIHIPMADEVDGLRDYYLSFIGETSGVENLENADFNLAMTPLDSYGYKYYEITWDKTTEDENALYTLVCYSEDETIFLPVRTIHGDEAPVARVGTAVRLSGITLTTLKNGVTDEDRYFKLYVTWPDGRMQSSEMFHADF
jgi:hypothetical protein